MEETYELRSKLCEISTKIEEYKTSHKDVLTTKEEYIDLRAVRPEKKSEKEPRAPFNTKIAKIVLISLLLALNIFSAVTCIVGISTVFIWFVSVPALAFCFISLLITYIVGLLLLGEIIYTHIAKKKYEKAVLTVAENLEYNKNEYPTLLEKYERQRKELICEYEKKVERAKDRIDSLEEYFKENASVINKKYYLDIDRIITALDEQRATRLNDAINLVLRDKRIEKASSKHKKGSEPEHEHEDELYPCGIMERAKVNSINCISCERRDTCVKLYCQMNPFFDKKDDEDGAKEECQCKKEEYFEGEILSEQTEIIE